MGAKGDIRMYRNGPRHLVVDSDVEVLGKITSGNFDVKGTFMINGEDLQAVCRVLGWTFTQLLDKSSVCA